MAIRIGNSTPSAIYIGSTPASHLYLGTELIYSAAVTNSAAPSITGSPRVNNALTGNTGTWIGVAPLTYERRYQESTDGITALGDISGATGATYTPNAGRQGRYIRVGVRATDANGVVSDWEWSPWVGPVAAAYTAPILVTPYSWSGDLITGHELTITPPVYSGNPTPTVRMLLQSQPESTTTIRTDITSDPASVTKWYLDAAMAGRQPRIIHQATNAAGTTAYIYNPFLGTIAANSEPLPQPIWTEVSRATISIPASIQVPAGQTEVWIPISVDHTDRESFYCYISGLQNISGGGINVGNAAAQRAAFDGLDINYRWSPGDDLAHYLHITCATAHPAGRRFRAQIAVRGLGDTQKGSDVDISFVNGAQHPVMPAQFHRPLRRLDLTQAQRQNVFNPATVQHNDTGFISGTPVWRSRLSHGYTQDGNGETGIYLNDQAFPGVAQSPITYDATEDAVRLHTLAFPAGSEPSYGGKSYAHQAAVIQGQTLNDVCGAEGVWRMVAKIPVRRYSWPAFWLVGRGQNGASGGGTQWPPEIDILEKFNYVWGGADTPFTTTFAQHYGNAGSNSRIGTFGNEVEVNTWIPGTGALNEDYHSWACAVTYHPTDQHKSEVTFFFDDIEVGCQVLHARHQNMVTKLPLYPIANVAVRAPGTYTPAQYNTDDGRGLIGDSFIRDIAYYPSGATMPPVSSDEPDPIPGTVTNPPFATALNWMAPGDMSHSPFINVLKIAPELMSYGGSAPDLDWDALQAAGHITRNGTINSLPPNKDMIASSTLNRFPAGSGYSGRYRLFYTGSGQIYMNGVDNVDDGTPGQIDFDFTANGENSVFFSVWGVTTPITFVAMVRHSDLAAYAAGQVFDTKWLNIIRNERVIRFRQYTNAGNYIGTINWATRYLPERMTYMGSGEGGSGNRGVPVEVMCDICNAVGADPWFPLIASASDSYATSFATLVRDRLDPKRHAYFELSDKVWDGANFATADYFRQLANTWYGSTSVESCMDAYGGRSAEVFTAIRAVWAGQLSRLHTVLQGWTPVPTLSVNVFTAPQWRALGSGRPEPWTLATEYAVHCNMDGAMRGTDPEAGYDAVAEIQGWMDTLTDAEIYANMIQALRGTHPIVNDGYNLASIRANYQATKTTLAAYLPSLNTICYEGISHLVLPPGKQDDPKWIRIYRDLHRTAAFRDFMADVMTMWYQEWPEASHMFMRSSECRKPDAHNTEGLTWSLEDTGSDNLQYTYWVAQRAARKGATGRGSGDFVGTFEVA